MGGREEEGEGVAPSALLAVVKELLPLIEDAARRAVLQLAFLRRWPKTFSQCCKEPHCFKCKVGNHHEGISCEDVQRDVQNRHEHNDEIQVCMGCGVVTCVSITASRVLCLCGEEWSPAIGEALT